MLIVRRFIEFYSNACSYANGSPLHSVLTMNGGKTTKGLRKSINFPQFRCSINWANNLSNLFSIEWQTNSLFRRILLATAWQLDKPFFPDFVIEVPLFWIDLGSLEFQILEKSEVKNKYRKMREKIDGIVWNQRSKTEATRVKLFPSFEVTSFQLCVFVQVVLWKLVFPFVWTRNFTLDEDILWRCEPTVQEKGCDLMKINRN